MLTDRLHRLAAPDAPRDHGEARRFATHLVSLLATKTADGLIEPKLVLAWLLQALGAPAALIGALVPVREAGALLPQLVLAGRIQALRRRKWVWAAGAAAQGLAALGIALAALTLEGAAAGLAIVGCLALLAVARSACSASHKDLVARTIEEGSRGALSGTAGSLSAALVLGFSLLLATGLIPLETSAIAIAIAVAGALWLAGAAVFATLGEAPAEDAARTGGLGDMLAPLREDGEFRAYLAARALLIATALAPPYLVVLSGQGTGEDRSLGNLGALMIASAAASILSSYVWGRLSDRSSRLTLMAAGALSGAVLAAAAATGWATGGLGGAAGAAGFVFAAQLGYEAARQGRKVHLTDMDTHGRKPVYTALANTLIGVALIAAGALGVIADLAGPETVLALFAVLCLAAVPVAARLSEVQRAG